MVKKSGLNPVLNDSPRIKEKCPAQGADDHDAQSGQNHYQGPTSGTDSLAWFTDSVDGILDKCGDCDGEQIRRHETQDPQDVPVAVLPRVLIPKSEESPHAVKLYPTEVEAKSNRFAHAFSDSAPVISPKEGWFRAH